MQTAVSGEADTVVDFVSQETRVNMLPIQTQFAYLLQVMQT
jgi:hypothetical protein